jgi:hypothetical protein
MDSFRLLAAASFAISSAVRGLVERRATAEVVGLDAEADLDAVVDVDIVLDLDAVVVVDLDVVAVVDLDAVECRDDGRLLDPFLDVGGALDARLFRVGGGEGAMVNQQPTSKRRSPKDCNGGCSDKKEGHRDRPLSNYETIS